MKYDALNGPLIGRSGVGGQRLSRDDYDGFGGDFDLLVSLLPWAGHHHCTRSLGGSSSLGFYSAN